MPVRPNAQKKRACPELRHPERSRRAKGRIDAPQSL